MQVVLNRMVGCKKLTREQADALAAEAVTLQIFAGLLTQTRTCCCTTLVQQHVSCCSGTQKAPRNGKWTRCAVHFLRYLVWKRRNHVVPEKGFAAFPSGDSILPENFGKSVVHP